MSKINSMTEAQQQQMVEFREQWRQIGLATGFANIEAVRPTINDFYNRIGEQSPYLWCCSSPLMANMIINLIRDNLGDNLWDNLGVNLGANLRVNLRVNLRANLGDNLWDNLGDNLRDNLWQNLGQNLRQNLRDNLGANLEFINTFFGGSLDSYWVAYYLFPHYYLRKMHTLEQYELLLGWGILAKNIFWWYPYKGICFVCDRPDEYHFDNQWRLHNPDGMSVRFSDGWGLYAVHGVMLPAWIIEQPENITVDKIHDERNTEVKRILIDKYGQSRYLLDSGAKLINSDGYGDLYRADLQDDEPLVMVKVVNSTPETDGSYKDYFVRVPPDTQTAEQAVAWLGGLEVGKFQYISQS